MADRSGIVNKINNYQNKANKVYQFSFLDEIKKGKEALRPTKDEDHFQKEFDSISIGSEQELNGVIVSTAEKSRAGSFATAYDSEENPLLEVTTDIKHGGKVFKLDDFGNKIPGSRPNTFEIDEEKAYFTIEIISHPIELNNKDGIDKRKLIFENIVNKINDLAKINGSLTSGPLNEGSKLAVKKEHKIHYDFGKDSVSGSVNQATIGVAVDAIGTGDNGGEFIENAPWWNNSFKGDVNDSEDNGFVNFERVQNIYALIMSVIYKFCSIVGSQKVKVGNLSSQPGYENFSKNLWDSNIKNLWGLVPRSNIWGTLDILDLSDKVRIIKLIKNKVKESSFYSDTLISGFCLDHVEQKLDLAGHPVDGAKVGGKDAALFEYRSENNMPEEIKSVFWRVSKSESPNEVLSESFSEGEWESTDEENTLRWSNEIQGKWWFCNKLDNTFYSYETSSGVYSDSLTYEEFAN